MIVGYHDNHIHTFKTVMTTLKTVNCHAGYVGPPKAI